MSPPISPRFIRRSLLPLLILIFVAAPLASSLKISPTDAPPLTDVPVYSLATLNADGSSDMNILTYCTPVSIRPVRLFALGLYGETLTAENFLRGQGRGGGVLQLLTPRQADVVRTLGGASGRDVDKQKACEDLGHKWVTLGECTDGGGGRNGEDPMVLSGCAHYIRLRQIGESVDGGSHHAVVCAADGMYVGNELEAEEGGGAPVNYLSTGTLRSMGIISELGRVIP
mmetsp:Transcript_12726/g.28091  ORF Transcript_12726/g.28091 Transcript_12726/m.28091 type:complete len:228 (+) Transcript_12726:58-741(+)